MDPPTKAEITTALKALGDTPDAVAEAIRTRNCRGPRCAYADCPIAMYLRRTFNWCEKTWVAGPLAVVDGVQCPLPAAVRSFQHRFDAGTHYADLDTTPPKPVKGKI